MYKEEKNAFFSTTKNFTRAQEVRFYSKSTSDIIITKKQHIKLYTIGYKHRNFQEV